MALARSAGDSPCATSSCVLETPERGKHWGGERRQGRTQDEAHALAFCMRVSGQMGVAEEPVDKRPEMSAAPVGVRLCREGSGE